MLSVDSGAGQHIVPSRGVIGLIVTERHDGRRSTAVTCTGVQTPRAVATPRASSTWLWRAMTSHRSPNDRQHIGRKAIGIWLVGAMLPRCARLSFGPPSFTRPLRGAQERARRAEDATHRLVPSAPCASSARRPCRAVTGPAVLDRGGRAPAQWRGSLPPLCIS